METSIFTSRIIGSDGMYSIMMVLPLGAAVKMREILTSLFQKFVEMPEGKI